MYLRKHLVNRRIAQIKLDYPARKLALEMSGEPPTWLVLDVCEGPSLTDGLPEEFFRDPVWPSFDLAIGDPDIWREYPQLTPALRNTLAAMPEHEARGLYRDVRDGAFGQFFVYRAGKKTGRALAFQLPRAEAKNFTEKTFDTALQAASYLCRDELVAGRGEQDKQIGRRQKRIRKALRRLDKEQARLEDMLAKTEQAEILKAALHRFDTGTRLESVTAPGPDGRPVTINLDPGLTLLENMNLMFKQARKAKRGFGTLDERRAELSAELESLEQGNFVSRDVRRPVQNRLPKEFQGLQVNMYKSSNGFLILRGKNSRANHQLLSRAAGPHDLWFHVQGGPGAHVVVKLDYENQDTPQSTMREAAVLAGLASYAGQDARAEVMCAKVKHVRKPKGAPPGRVIVDRVEQVLVVELDPGLEQRLKYDIEEKGRKTTQ